METKKTKANKETTEAVSMPVHQVLSGVVVSRKTDKTATVLVNRYEKHPKYEKHIKRSKKYLAHDAENATREGDKVSIISIRPMSRHKHFAIKEILERGAMKNGNVPSMEETV